MKIKQSRIALFALVLVVVGAAGFWAVFQTSNGLAAQRKTVDVNKTFSAASIEQFSLSTDIADVKLLPSNGREIQVRMFGDILNSDEKYAKIEANQTGGKLTVKARTSKSFQTGLDVPRMVGLIAAGSDLHVHIEVSLPDRMYQSLQLSSNTGDLDVSSLKASNVKLSSDTGDIAVIGLQSDKANVSTSTGSIVLEKAAGNIQVSSDTGSIDLHLETIEHDITAKTATGDISIAVAKPSALQMDFRSDTGKTTTDLPDINFESKERHVLVGEVGNSGPMVLASSNTGSISLNKGE
jgi:DUF4097 and DUF4098 domain-containing protein YvlB